MKYRLGTVIFCLISFGLATGIVCYLDAYSAGIRTSIEERLTSNHKWSSATLECETDVECEAVWQKWVEATSKKPESN